MIAANNHYVGFGLLTTNIFRKIVGPVELSQTYEIPLQQQTGQNNHMPLELSNSGYQKASWNKTLVIQKENFNEIWGPSYYN